MKERTLKDLPYTRSEIERLIAMCDEATEKIGREIMADNESYRIHLDHGYTERDLYMMNMPVIFKGEGEDPDHIIAWKYTQIAQMLRHKHKLPEGVPLVFLEESDLEPEYLREFKKFMLEIPLEEMPLYMNKPRYKVLAKWRLEIGK